MEKSEICSKTAKCKQYLVVCHWFHPIEHVLSPCSVHMPTHYIILTGILSLILSFFYSLIVIAPLPIIISSSTLPSFLLFPFCSNSFYLTWHSALQLDSSYPCLPYSSTVVSTSTYAIVPLAKTLRLISNSTLLPFHPLSTWPPSLHFIPAPFQV